MARGDARGAGDLGLPGHGRHADPPRAGGGPGVPLFPLFRKKSDGLMVPLDGLMVTI